MKKILLISLTPFVFLLLAGCVSQQVTQPAGPVVDAATGAFVVEADDSGLYPAVLSAAPGSQVKILFKIRSDNVYFGGIAVKSRLFETGDIKAGGEKLVTFTMPPQDVSFTSYWPASGARKADGVVKARA